jgi:hypothetical protein
MNILPIALRSPSRTLMLAAALTLTAVSLPAVHAHADAPEGGSGAAVTCSWGTGTYSPGGVVVETDGTKHTCQKDGTWSFAMVSVDGGALSVSGATGGFKGLHAPVFFGHAPLPAQQ